MNVSKTDTSFLQGCCWSRVGCDAQSTGEYCHRYVVTSHKTLSSTYE